VMEKDGSGNFTGKDAELDALLSAADGAMLDAIRDNLDLDTGLAQILGDLAGITPASRPTGPAEAEPGGHAHSYGHTLDPVPACKVPGAAREISSPAGPKTRKEPRDHHKTLTTLALAVITALSIALLCSLSYNLGAVGARSGASPTSPKRIVGEPARELWPFPSARQHQLIVLPGKAGASASLSLVAYNAGIGGDPVISYLKDSRSGPVLLLSGFPAGTAIRFLSTGADQSCRTRSAASRRNHPFPPGGERFSPGTKMCITGGNGRTMLKTVQNQPTGEIRVIATWFPDLM
jgi:hypothetical protein